MHRDTGTESGPRERDGLRRHRSISWTLPVLLLVLVGCRPAPSGPGAGPLDWTSTEVGHVCDEMVDSFGALGSSRAEALRLACISTASEAAEEGCTLAQWRQRLESRSPEPDC